MDDIVKLKEKEHCGVVGAIIGKAIYEGVVNLKEAVDLANAK